MATFLPQITSLAGIRPSRSSIIYRSAVALFALVWSRGARWFVFKPKIPIWVNVGGSCYGKSWHILLPLGTYSSRECSLLLYILWPLEIFYGHLVNFVVIWYIFPRFGILDQVKSGNPGLKKATLESGSWAPHNG
jgi:hypothetical protein